MASMVGPDRIFWRGKKVLVTGHTGYKGTWLCLWLERLGAIPMGLSLPAETQRDLSVSINQSARMEQSLGDIRNGNTVMQAFARFQPDVVLHLAAQALVRKSYGEPVATFETNVMGTVHVLEAVRQTKSVRAVVVVTSDKCYENREWFWPYREEEPMGGSDPYSASKGCTELVVTAWKRSYFDNGRTIGIASARAGNVIGGGDWALDRLIPDCVRSMAAGQPVSIRNPNATRPWQHVLEPLSGYLLLAERLWSEPERFSEGWNFGPNSSDIKPVSWLVERVTRLWGPEARWELVGGDHPHEAGYLAVDASKARAVLGWRARLLLDATLSWTMDFYKRQHSGEAPLDLAMAQIEKYETIEMETL